MFKRYIGIDYSGAALPVSPLKGLRCYVADGQSLPKEALPHGNAKYWSRKGLARWLCNRLQENVPTIVGIDHSFSFPATYFEKYHLPKNLPKNWDAFLHDFCRHWPTDADDVTVTMIKQGQAGNGSARTGSAKWRRKAEVIAKAKSVFHFGVPGSVAHSTHAGLPWLRFLKQETNDLIHFWPFDGWTVPKGRSVVAEAYPSLWSALFLRANRTPDQHDAYTIVAWLQQSDCNGDLEKYFSQSLSAEVLQIAHMEGWILGVSPTP